MQINSMAEIKKDFIWWVDMKKIKRGGKIYKVIDEMYNQVNGKDIEDVLSPNMISNIITEAFAESLDTFVKDIHSEISESVKPAKVVEPKKINEGIKAKKVFIKMKK